MANLNVQNFQNSVTGDLRFKGDYNGNVFSLYPSRYTSNGRQKFSFVASTVSKFPRDSLGAYNEGMTTLNFTTGVIAGADQTSPDFTPVVPTSGNGIVAVLCISTADVLAVYYGTVKTFAAAEMDFDSNVFPSVPSDMIPLYAFLIRNGGVISSVGDIRPDFSNAVFGTDDVLFTTPTNSQVDFRFMEYLSATTPISTNTLSIWGTKLKANDAITILSTAGSFSTTVQSVSYGFNAADTVTLQANVPIAFTVANSSHVVLSSYLTLRQAVSSRSRLLYDSGWNSASVGSGTTLTHNMARSPFTYTVIVYFNTSQTMQGARVLHQSADTGLTQTYGVQVRLNSNSFTLKFGSSHIYPILDGTGHLSSTVTSGYFRAIVVAN